MAAFAAISAAASGSVGIGGTLSALMSSASQFAYFIEPEFISRRSCFTYEEMTRFEPSVVSRSGISRGA